MSKTLRTKVQKHIIIDNHGLKAVVYRPLLKWALALNVFKLLSITTALRLWFIDLC